MPNEEPQEDTRPLSSKIADHVIDAGCLLVVLLLAAALVWVLVVIHRHLGNTLN